MWYHLVIHNDDTTGTTGTTDTTRLEFNSSTDSLDGEDQSSPLAHVHQADSCEEFRTFYDPSEQVGRGEFMTGERSNRGQ